MENPEFVNRIGHIGQYKASVFDFFDSIAHFCVCDIFFSDECPGFRVPYSEKDHHRLPVIKQYGRSGQINPNRDTTNMP
jgi:hypothetical protein